jgi:hypothetical protein
MSTWVPLSHMAAPRTHAQLVLTLEKVPMLLPLFLIKGHQHMGIHAVPLNPTPLPKQMPTPPWLFTHPAE